MSTVLLSVWRVPRFAPPPSSPCCADGLAEGVRRHLRLALAREHPLLVAVDAGDPLRREEVGKVPHHLADEEARVVQRLAQPRVPRQSGERWPGQQHGASPG
mgnify:CR=1 FL=1